MVESHAGTRGLPTSYHWGSFDVEVTDGRVRSVEPVAEDGDPSPIGRSIAGTLDDPARIGQPMVRAGFLARMRGEAGASAGEGRGAEPFVPVSWSVALDLIADELRRIKTTHGNEAIFAGSYGWASAGRFHHSQSQLRRFLNLYGGHVFHKNSYSLAAAGVILPHIVGDLYALLERHTPWSVIAEHGELVVAFGGLPLKNAQINQGGVGRHAAAAGMRECRERGVAFVNIGPLREDIPDFLNAEWLAPRPNSDTALMLGLAHTLVAEGLHDRLFLARYCVGWERFEPYLMGRSDGVPKDADWAAAICGLPATTLRQLARRMAKSRTLISVAWSLQRADHGEQPFWMATVLAAILGQIGLPGGGIGWGYNAVHGIGANTRRVPWAAVPQGENKVTTFIPVARIADMLLNPGTAVDYDGEVLTYPDIRMVYWAGGNPFHHHQDLNRLILAWRKPETIIVHEPWWTAAARHADIVLPATTTLERNDLGATSSDSDVTAMHQAVAPHGEARSEFAIFAELAGRLGFREAYTEGRDEMEWLRHLWELSRQRASQLGLELPDFDNFWAQGRVSLPAPEQGATLLAEFRADPDANRLTTPSGRIEIFSERIASFGYDGNPGHPVWQAPREWLGAKLAERYTLHLISNQPTTRLHSQLDNGATSRDSKIAGREPIKINPQDAAARGIEAGDVVRVFNARGACLAGAIVTDAVRPGVVLLSTGAWYDPLEPGRIGTLDRHGNPNVLTRDEGCSKLSQGPSAQSTLVELERFAGVVPPIRAFDPPPMA
jgi:biotin/methionine sulfoxide reductase